MKCAAFTRRRPRHQRFSSPAFTRQAYSALELPLLALSGASIAAATATPLNYGALRAQRLPAPSLIIDAIGDADFHAASFKKCPEDIATILGGAITMSMARFGWPVKVPHDAISVFIAYHGGLPLVIGF